MLRATASEKRRATEEKAPESGQGQSQPGASLPLSQALLAPAGRSGGLWAPGTAVHGHPQPNPALSSGSGSKGPKHSGRQTIRGGLLAEILQSCTLARDRERPLL